MDIYIVQLYQVTVFMRMNDKIWLYHIPYKHSPVNITIMNEKCAIA
jgi:hypothetical protein